MLYTRRVDQLNERLGNRHLVYFGLRGSDSRPLLALHAFHEVFCYTVPLEASPIQEICLETLKGMRMDLNRYSVDEDRSGEAGIFRRKLLEAFETASAVVPYRPVGILTSAWFPRFDQVDYLGLFHEKQRCFEHKPWVETQLRKAGARTLPWSYYSGADMSRLQDAVADGPLVVRTSRSRGGVGIEVFYPGTKLEPGWMATEEGFVAAAPFLRPSIPLNVNACVFPGGCVAMHPPSLQLIGIPECTSRTLGYCGNDFARIGELDDELLDELNETARIVGEWLFSQGYLGAYGIDALVFEGKIFLVEVNPRFQSSSPLAARLMRGLNRSDIYLDHMAAFMGLEPPSEVSLTELARTQSSLSYVVCYSPCSAPVRVADPENRLGVSCEGLPASNVKVEPGGVLFQSTFSGSVTQDGLRLSPAMAKRVRRARDAALRGRVERSPG